MLNFINSRQNVDQFRTGFLYAGDNGPAFDEATFLTFSIDFELDDSSASSLPIQNIDFMSHGLTLNPLFDLSPDSTHSAYNFLLNRDFTPEAARLEKFVKLLANISNSQPWFFQSISGLNKLWANATNMEQNMKAKDAVLTFETLESLDLRLTYLADLYRHAIYDTIYMRELVPDILRYFKMVVYVSEFRDLRLLKVLNPFDYFSKNYSFLKFDCRMCEFDFSKSMPIAEPLTINSGEMAKNQFDVKVGHYLEQHSYSFHDVITKETWTKHEQETIIRDDIFNMQQALLVLRAAFAVTTSPLYKNIAGTVTGAVDSTVDKLQRLSGGDLSVFSGDRSNRTSGGGSNNSSRSSRSGGRR